MQTGTNTRTRVSKSQLDKYSSLKSKRFSMLATTSTKKLSPAVDRRSNERIKEAIKSQAKVQFTSKLKAN